jgi:plastocyanin
MKMSRILSVLVLIFLLSGFSCKKKTESPSTPEGPGTNEVWMQSNAFSPATITVPVNTTITWINKDQAAHNVISDGGLFSSSTINSGGTYSRQFTSPGTFPYHCSFHSGMNGQVVVQ